jgi:VWFA-related protein
MRQRHVLLAALLLLAGALPGIIGQTQQDTPQPPPPTLEITGVNASNLPEITISGSVLNSRNQPATDLTPADFTLSGALADVATITDVENITADDLSFATVLAIDVSSSMAGQPLEDAKEAARLFVQSVGADDPIALVTFSSQARLVQDYTTDKQQLINVIDNLAFGGQTALYDAAELSVDVADDAPVARRAVVLLSDGNEFGGLSQAARQDAVNTALSQGVPVYTIGLGFFLDEPYLGNLSSETNARFYQSPDSSELDEIYAELAQLFRSQYVLTLNAPDVPLDGTEYPFSLQAQTADGQTRIAESVVRAPIPVPLVELNLPDGAVSEPVTIAPQIRADDAIAAVEFRLDGEPLTASDNQVTIDPAEYAPGRYDLAVRVTDEDGDSNLAEGTLQIAALPPESVRLITRFGDDPITEPQTVSVEFNSQTDVQQVIYSIQQNGNTVFEQAMSDSGSNFELTFDPFSLAPGDYTIQATVENAAETSTTAEVSFSVGDVPPRVGNIGGLQPGQTLDAPATLQLNPQAQAGASIADSDVQFVTPGLTVPDDLTLQPINIPPGERAIEVTVTDSRGLQTGTTLRFSVPALPPRITFTGESIRITEPGTPLDVQIDSQTPLTSVTYDIGAQTGTADERGGVYLVPVDTERLDNNTYTLSVTAQDESGQMATGSTQVIVDVPTPTPTFTPTPNATQTEAALRATSQAESTLVARTTAQAQATTNAEATADAIRSGTATAVQQSTSQAQATADTQRTSTAVAEANQEATLDANATEVERFFVTREANATSTQQAIEQVTVQAEQTATDEAVQQATSQAQQEATNEANQQATLQAQQTATDEAQANITATAQEVAAANLRATDLAQATQTESASIEASATRESSLTETAVVQSTQQAENDETATAETISSQQTATADAIPTETDTPLPTETAAVTETAEPTATVTATTEPTATVTATSELPTLTPAAIEDVDAQDAPPLPDNSTGLLLVAAGVALFILLILLLLRGRRQSQES